MRQVMAGVLLAGAGVAMACVRVKPEAPAEIRPVAQTGAARPPGGPPPQRRQPPHPMKLDTLRKQAIAELLAGLQGRENEPAGTVFKNVQLYKDTPVREFLTMMDEEYGRALSVNCTSCHMDNKDYASDNRKDKVIARQMVRMQRDIDRKYIAKVKELDDPRPKTTCVMCHRGAGHLTNTMDVPTEPVPSRKR